MSQSDLIAYLEKAKQYIDNAETYFEVGDFQGTIANTCHAIISGLDTIQLVENLKLKSGVDLIASFGKSFVEANIFSRKMSSLLKKASELHESEEIDIENTVDKKDAEESLKIGKDFIDKIVEYLKNNNLL